MRASIVTAISGSRATIQSCLTTTLGCSGYLGCKDPAAAPLLLSGISTTGFRNFYETPLKLPAFELGLFAGSLLGILTVRDYQAAAAHGAMELVRKLHNRTGTTMVVVNRDS